MIREMPKKNDTSSPSVKDTDAGISVRVIRQSEVVSQGVTVSKEEFLSLWAAAVAGLHRRLNRKTADGDWIM
jgi:hypothetical protein